MSTLMTCSGEGLANVKIKWLQGFASSRITEQILIMTLWKAAMGIHSHSRSSIPIPYFYSYSHCRDIIIVTPIPMGIPCDPWDTNCSYSHAHLYYRVFQKKVAPLKLFGIFSLRLSRVKFCRFVGNFCRFIFLFHQMSLMFPRVPIVLTLSSFE